MSRENVARVLEEHAAFTVVPNGEKFEDRRRSLLIPVIDAMPGGQSRWGILKKSGGVPSDIIVDLNMDHVDVFSGADLGDGTSRITPNFTNYGDFRRPDRKWRRATVQEALAEGWIEPLPETPPAPKPQPEQPTPAPPPSSGDLEARLSAIEARVNKHLAP